MLAIAFGTRPEWLKIKSLVQKLKEEEYPFGLIFTGQHSTLVDTKEIRECGASWFVECEKIEASDKNRMNTILCETIGDSDYLKEMGCTHLIVQGDTTSALSMAISAFHQKIKVIHLEAGLRTYNKEQPFPEEMNRQLISKIADIHLCPTVDNYLNLESEKIQGEKFITGNSVLDLLKGIYRKEENKILVTLHRRENQNNLKEWFEAIEKIAIENEDVEFIFPIHPSPNVRRHKDILQKVKVIEPLEHEALLDLLSRSRCVITDSGGIQEEAAFLGVPCIVCRKETERTEGLGNFSVLCEEPGYLSECLMIAEQLDLVGQCPYGNGQTANIIYEEVIKRL